MTGREQEGWGRRGAWGAASAPAAAREGRPAVVCPRFDGVGADGAPVRLGIMGGTFDPIHQGHLACAEQAREAFGLAGVVFVPTGRPAFKRDRAVTDGAVRLEMCRAAVAGNPAFAVSPLEEDPPRITYAEDTLRALRHHYPPNVELFFIAGADAILSIARWHESAEVARLARFAAATRPGFEVTESFKEELASRGAFRVDYFEVTALAISSSYLRERAARGLSLRYLTPDPVREIIEARGLYRLEAPTAAAAVGGGKEAPWTP